MGLEQIRFSSDYETYKSLILFRNYPPHTFREGRSIRRRTPLLLLATLVVGLLLAGPANHAAAQGATAPGLTSASAQGNLVYADYDQALDESHTPPPNAYVIRINGRRTTVQNVAVSGQRVTLTLQTATIDGDTVLLTYRHRAQPTLRSVSGVNATTVRNVAVEVLSFEAVVETFEPEQPEAASQVSGQAADDFIPTNFSVSIRNNGVRFSWDAPSSGTVRQYQLRHDTDANLSDGDTEDIVAGTTQHSVGTRGVTVWGQVRAQDDSDGTYGPWSHVLYATGNRPADRQVPTTPAAPTVTAGDTQLTVTWTAPADHGYIIVRYSVEYRATGATNWTEVRRAWALGDTTLSYTIENLTNGSPYEVRVLATSIAGNSAWSDSTTGTPAAAVVQPTTNDYDSDNDSLIEVDSLAKLNAMRYDLDGNGVADETANNAAYAAAFPNPASDQCDDTDTTETETCVGYELTADLDFDDNTAGNRTDDTYYNSGAGWDPIGDRPRFTATFEGNDNTIANLFISHPTGNHDRLGLFARLENATVRNLTLTGASVTGDDRVGLLAGQSYGTTVISGVSVSGDVTAGDDIVGGLVGATSDDTTIEDASASGSVTGNVSVGGLVGDNSGTIKRSRSSANVFGNENDAASGRVGGLVGATSGAITASFATGSVRPLGNADSVNAAGGLIGELDGSIVITASYAAGSVSGSQRIGGLIGTFTSGSGSVVASYATGSVSGSEDVGGLIGSADVPNVVVTASYSTGAVTGATNAGGLIGHARTVRQGTNTVIATTVTDSYWDTESSGQSNSAGGTGKTGAELRAPTSYTGIYANWNLDLNSDNTNDDPWDFGAAHNYPTLRNTGGNQKGPGPVQNLTVTEVGGQAQVRWDAPTGADGTITYELRSLSDDGSDSASWSTWITATSPHTLPLPEAGETLRVEVRTVGTAAHSRSEASSGSVDGPAVQTDYDSDDDGLLEITTLAQLDAIRYDLDGNGVADAAANDDAYATAFPNPVSDQCDKPGTTLTTETCTGYELAANLDFDTGTTGDRTDDTYYNGGAGWLPIAGVQNIGTDEGFQATFEGNGGEEGYTISNLFINRAYATDDIWAGYRIGLFGTVGDMASISKLNLTDVDVTGDEEVGGLAGISLGAISEVSVTGDVTGATIDVGGLVGFLLRGSLIDSTFDGTVSGTASHMGGLVGANTGATIRYSEAAGTVAPSGSSSGHVGGLAGSNTGTIAASYSTSTVNANDAYWVGGLVGTNGGMYAKGSGRIIACYADNDVHGKGDVGGLVGENYASISTSYSTGEVVKHGGQYAGPVGGLVGRNELNNNDSTVYYSVTNSYWDSDLTNWNFGVGSDDDNRDNVVDNGESNTVLGYPTVDLKTPTGYTSLFANWNVDVDGDNTDDDPWDFGTDNQYPVLK